jgi:hypothetical protein
MITHNYDPARGAFRNLCNLSPSEAERILDEIRASGLKRLRPNYLERRLETEQWLYAERTRKLGVPVLRHPIYFFLGDFADGEDAARPASVILPLSTFAPAMVTFTYPDSMATLPLATREELAAHRKPYHGQVFTLEEIKDVVAAFGMPPKRSMTDSKGTFDTFIEVQVWDDTPLAYALAAMPRRLPPGARDSYCWGLSEEER